MENYSESLIEALAYAARAHASQERKSTQIPYLSHLLAVTAIVMEAGGTETEAIAALLHDVVEDQPMRGGGGRARLADVHKRFGPEVASIVESLSDWISEHEDEEKSSEDYRARKAAYHDHLRATTNKSVLLVSAADKLHNARSMAADVKQHGNDLWKRFNGTQAEIVWNFDELISIYRTAVPDDRRSQITEDLAEVVDSLKVSGR